MRDQLACAEGKATNPLQSDRRPAAVSLAWGDGKLCLSRRELAGVTAHRHTGDAHTQHQSSPGMGLRGTWMSLPPSTQEDSPSLSPVALAREGRTMPPREKQSQHLFESRAQL